MDKPGLAKLENNSGSRLEVDWLFFAQGGYVRKSESAIEPISPDLFLYIITLQYESSDAPRKTGMLIRGVSIPLKSAGRAHAYPQAPGL